MEQNYIEWNGEKIPYYDKKVVYADADKWLRRNKMILEREYAGRYVLVNARDQAGVAGQDFDKACLLYKEKHGPSPPEGRHFLGKQF